MDVWSWLLWGVAGTMVLGGMLKIMLVRRNQIVVQWHDKAAAEQKKANAAKKP